MRQERDTGRIVPGFDSFTVTEDGGVYRDGERLRSWVDPYGYWRVRVRASKRTGRRYFNKRISHLVAMAWLGIDPRRDAVEIWPLDGDASNHHAANLVTVSSSGDVIQFERDTRPKSDFDANQARKLRREWISRQNFRLHETIPEKLPAYLI